MRKQDINLAVVMPVLNCVKYSKQTFESFSTKYHFHWFIIDNGSTDETEQWVMSLGDNVTYIKLEKNIGVAAAWNLGIAKAFEAGFDPVFVINNDLLFAPDTVDNLLEWYGLESERKFEFVSVTNAGDTSELLDSYTRKDAFISSANFIGFVINHRTVKRVGWFDEGFKTAYFEDDDYKARLNKEGIVHISALDAPVAHFGSRTIIEGGVTVPEFTENRIRFIDKHGYSPEIASSKPLALKKKPKLLWCGDAVAPTGFARVTHSVLDWLQNFFEVHVLGVNYKGDPHPYPYSIYPSQILGGQTPWGVDRFIPLIEKLNPDVIMVMNDHWIVRMFLSALERSGRPIDSYPPIVAYIPVDAKNVANAHKLNDLAAAVFYTQFGWNEAVEGGFTGRAAVIPHGVNTNIFKSVDRNKAREAYGLGRILPEDAFIFGNVNRNQPRKRQDLSIKFFKEFVDRTGADNAYLYLHCATDDMGYDIPQLAHYFGVSGKVLVPSGNFGVWAKIKDELMYLVYNSFDVHMSTTQGEGWGFCVDSETDIWVPGGVKKIKDVELGDNVLSEDGHYHKVLNKVSRYSKVNKIKILGGKEVNVTEDHLLLIRQKKTSKPIEYYRRNDDKPIWLEAKYINKGDFVAVPYPKLDFDLPEHIDILDYIDSTSLEFNSDYVWYKMGFSPKSSHLSIADVQSKYSVSKRIAEEALSYLRGSARNQDIANNKSKYVDIANRIKADGHEYEPEVLKVKRFIPVNEKFLELCGWYLAEGSLFGGSGLELDLCYKDEYHKAVTIKSYIEELFDISCVLKERPDKNVITVHLSSKVIANFFSAFFGRGAENKNIPTVLMKSPKLLGPLVKGYFLGDGHIGDSSIISSSISKILCDQLHQILLANKIYSYIRKVNRKRAIFTVRIPNKDINKFCEYTKIRSNYKDKSRKIGENIIYSDDYVYVPVMDCSSDDTKVEVYDIQVEDVHSFVGNGVLLHNSSLEAAACGVPQILPNWAALGDWASDIALMVPCSTVNVTTAKINTVGGVPDEEPFVDAMVELYTNEDLRNRLAKKGLELAHSEKFKWYNIAMQFRNILLSVMKDRNG